MIVKVNKDTFFKKRDLKTIFPKEFSNRLLINQFITYVLNNFFEKSKEKIVSAYVGEVVPGIDGEECYISEPNMERQINQIIPVVKSGDDYITYNNFISDLYSEGVVTNNQNKLLSSRHWSWCPPINVDMYINFNNYYWIGSDINEFPIKVIPGEVDVEKDVIGSSSYAYYEYDSDGNQIESSKIELNEGDRVVFLKDTSKFYSCTPYIVGGTSVDYLTLTPAIMPLVFLNSKTNVIGEIVGKSSYTYKDETGYLKDFDFVNGLRVIFLKDENNDYNNKPFIINGVGDKIELIEDTYIKECETPDYFVMERGCSDGNEWSVMNRWVHRNAIELFNVNSIDGSFENSNKTPLKHAAEPILCFNKDIELFNHGTYSRGYVDYVSQLKNSDLSGLDTANFAKKLGISYGNIEVGQTILLLGNVGDQAKQLYTINKPSVDDIIVLQVKNNGRNINGSIEQGDVVIVKDTSKMFPNTTIHFNGVDWVESQVKETVNQSPLFTLYNSDGISLDNEVVYPNSTFKGCKLFDYKNGYGVDSDLVSYEPSLNRYVFVDKLTRDYQFTNHLQSDVYTYIPYNEYETEINGYKYYKNSVSGALLNDWHLCKEQTNQYIKTIIEVSLTSKYETINIDDIERKCLVVEIPYTLSETSSNAPYIVSINGSYIESKYIIKKDDKTLLIRDTNVGDTVILSFITDEKIEQLENNYVYETPLSLNVNQTNKDIKEISYNNCFDQMIDIITKQKGIMGSPNGSNNYSSLNPDVSLGTKIVQTTDTLLRTMVLNNQSDFSVRASIEYVMNQYTSFKKKFINVLNDMYKIGEINDDMNTSNTEKIDNVIKTIIDRINIGKEGLLPFYNNGVMHLIENAYIPSTPSYLGIANCYEPRIAEFSDYYGEEKPNIIIGHDGSIKSAFGNIKDDILLRFETLIYASINKDFKERKCGINSQKFIFGKFRNNTYDRKTVIDTYSSFFNIWCNKMGIDYSINDLFDYSDDGWKTWNYTGTYDVDGEMLNGSYRSVYKYYYDTFNPHTNPWEMLGFGDKPDWWDEEYGYAPYTSSNKKMWSDLANGIILKGYNRGQHDELKRPGLDTKYLPVDSMGNLKSPMDIGIIENKPLLHLAKAPWKIGDIGEAEFMYQKTSEYMFAKELTNYLLRPTEWVETNWDTQNIITLFKDTPYEQIVNLKTQEREKINNSIMHNEMNNGLYVRNIGYQQWVSDYNVYNNRDITTFADKIRNIEVVLGYRCAGFYQKDTINVYTNSFGEIPNENIKLILSKSKHERTLTYSGVRITKTKKGFVVDGFDEVYPYFKMRLPEENGKKASIEENGKSVYYHITWKNDILLVPYKTEFKTIQDVYTFINGYGVYLEENEEWYFNTRIADGRISNFRTSSESFLKWATAQGGDESIGNMILLNPGSLGVGNYNNGVVNDLNELICGKPSIVDINSKLVDMNDILVLRQPYNTFVTVNGDVNIALLKFRTFDYEHMVVFDNKTIYGDVLYNPLYSTILSRFKLSGIKIKNWYGTLYTPGYLIYDDGAIPNFDKKASDVVHIFDVDNPKCIGKYSDYSKGIIGYKDNKVFKDLFQNNKAMFDYYKGSIKEKGTVGSINKMNRSTYVSSSGNNIEIFENWAFKAGEFGYSSDKATYELLLEPNKMLQNPQIITLETLTNNYYNENTSYNIGDVVVYNNHEYICLEETFGEFDASMWKEMKYVGNYIVYWDDEKWLKKPKNQQTSIVSYINDRVVNPIGGFALTTDCEYIVANEEEFDNIKTEMSVGETVWIVKCSNDDWDILKKTGVNKFVSMRYNTIDDVVKQTKEEYVYHFTDNKSDYYTTKNSSEIGLMDPVYEDIDCNNSIYRWCDIIKPDYTGYIGKYENGKKYKVKFYNTVFSTLTPQSQLNSGTIFTSIESNEMITYSNMLLNMVVYEQEEKFKYKYNFSITIDTLVDDTCITINGEEYINPKNKTVNLVVCGGDVINWKTYAHNCGERSGTVVIPTDGSEQKLSFTVPMSYRNGSILCNATTPITENEVPFVAPGKYEVSLVGGGGGAGGGSWKKNHKHNGAGGAGGAYGHFVITITDDVLTNDNTKYYITSANGGAGGKCGKAAGYRGYRGGDSALTVKSSKANGYIVLSEGGASNRGAREDYNYDYDGRPLAKGGLNKTNDFGGLYEIEVLSDSKSGNNANGKGYGAKPGKSVYPSGYYGNGGNSVYKENGKPGNNGIAIVEYIGGATEYTDADIVWGSKQKPVSVEKLKTNSLDYSTYYQSYVIPRSGNEEMYFYSYDVLFDDPNRPNAKYVSDKTEFFRYRSKSINAYHKDTVVKNLWSNTEIKQYYYGDTVTYNKKYYICTLDHISTQTFNTDVWAEYKPTYYYKITYCGEDNIDALDPFKNNYELYEDKECTIRATKDSIDSMLMTTSDLDGSRDYEVGQKFSLVEPFVTYDKLQPLYINEPMWGNISNMASYSISSGMIEYYVNTNKDNIENDLEALVYTDVACSTPAKQIVMKNNGTSISYMEVNLKYSDLCNVETPNMVNSYEMKDGELLLYTKKPLGEIKNDDVVYYDETLLNVAGVYSDFIPIWEKTNNSNISAYLNTLKIVDYKTRNLMNVDNSIVENFTTIVDSNGDEYPLYYKNDDVMTPYFAPCCSNDGIIDYCKMTDMSLDTRLRLYKCESIVVDMIEYIDDLPSPSEYNVGDICCVIKDMSVGRNKLTNYYILNESNVWEYKCTYDDAMKDMSMFKQVTTDLNIDIINDECMLYAENINSNVLTDVVKLYYNDQCIGEYVESSNILIETDKMDNLYIQYTNIEDDIMYLALKKIKQLTNIESTEKAIDDTYEEIINNGGFIDKDVLKKCWSKYRDYQNYDRYFDNRKCKIYQTYRTTNEKPEYIKLYQYGYNYYISKSVKDYHSNIVYNIGVKYGSKEEITEYFKTDVNIPLQDKIVNVISYMNNGDYVYITNDSYGIRSKIMEQQVLSDPHNILLEGGLFNGSGEKGWLKLEYTNTDSMFNILSVETKMLSTNNIDSCYLVDNDTDTTMVNVYVYDPIQNIIPNNVLDEVNYISSLDPVNDYSDYGKWNDQKIGYLWWDTSKVRYIDYHQGDLEYRRMNWGKQLPGSEIVVNEWTKSITPPSDGTKYITYEKYNYETDTLDVYYYYWVKNPTVIPNVAFRKNSAMLISSIINNPTEEGIIWVAPIELKQTNSVKTTFIVSNFNNVMIGQNAVLQINVASEKDTVKHTEWVKVRENAIDDIPEYLWEKLKDSLLGIKYTPTGDKLQVPNESLSKSQKLGIGFRPRQTMFNNIFNARENFIDIINDIFASRNYDELSVDINSGLLDNVDMPNKDSYYDVALTKLEMMSWKDAQLIGKQILVQSDETHDGIWVIYQINDVFSGEEGYEVVDYQKYNIKKYIEYRDWYYEDSIKYLTPIYTYPTQVEAQRGVLGLKENSVVEYKSDNEHELWQLRKIDGILEPMMVGKSNTLITIKPSIYSNNMDLDDTHPYLILNGKKITKKEYIDNEVIKLLEIIIDYFNS